MSFTRPLPQFGVHIDPAAQDPAIPLQRAQMADQLGLDLIAIMDHPYNRRLYETWTLLTFLAAQTERIRFTTDVANLPLRPPAMLAKQVASLHALTGGRVELGLGAGSYWDAIESFGTPRRTPGEAYGAFNEALDIMKAIWDPAGKSVSYQGETYQVSGLRPGPTPAQPIPIWVGGGGPRMLRLTGRKADGLLATSPYVPPAKLLEFNELIDAGAQSVDRDPGEIRRGYNLMGVLDLGRDDTVISEKQGANVYGPVETWVESIVELYRDYRQDTIIFWPVSGNPEVQLEAFATQVVPNVRAELGI